MTKVFIVSNSVCIGMLCRFVAYDVDMFGEPNFIGQHTIPVQCVRTGFRSVNLKNGHSEDLELSGKVFGLHAF